VDDGHVTGREPRLEVTAIEDAPKAPPRLPICGLKQPTHQRLVRLRLHARPAEQGSWPAGGTVLAPEIVLPRLLDSVVLAGQVLDGEANGDGLLVESVLALGSMRLTRLGTGFCPEDVQDEQAAGKLVRNHHLVDDCDGDSRIVAEPAHPAVTRVERRVFAGVGGESGESTVVFPNALPQLSIARRAAELLDPAMLIGWHRLVGELPAQPSC